LDRGQIREVVYRAIDQVNELLLDEDVLTKDDTTILLGEGSKLDSMGFINFVVALEEELAKAAGVDLNLMDELMPENVDPPPWSTVVELIEFLFVMEQAGKFGSAEGPGTRHGQ
jgi:acyl carrier protein